MRLGTPAGRPPVRAIASTSGTPRRERGLLAGDDKALAEIAIHKITEVSFEEIERSDRRFIRRLLRNLPAEEGS
jgi:hypothetical protein